MFMLSKRDFASAVMNMQHWIFEYDNVENGFHCAWGRFGLSIHVTQWWFRSLSNGLDNGWESSIPRNDNLVVTTEKWTFFTTRYSPIFPNQRTKRSRRWRGEGEVSFLTEAFGSCVLVFLKSTSLVQEITLSLVWDKTVAETWWHVSPP